MKIRGWLGLLLGMSAAMVQAEPAAILMQVSLRAKPERHAQAVAQLQSGEKVEVLRARGYWVEVQTSQGTGWLRLSALVLPPETITKNDSPLFGKASGRAAVDQEQ